MRNIYLFLFILPALVYLTGCSDDPASLGKELFSGQGLKVETMDIYANSATTKFTPVPLGNADYILVGKYSTDDTVEALTLLRFLPKIAGYQDNINIIDSAKILITQQYLYGESSAKFGIEASPIKSSWSSSTFTADSIGKITDSNIITSHSLDTSLYSMVIDTAVIRTWLQDTLGTNNFGLLLKPSAVTNKIVGYANQPILKIFGHKNGVAFDTSYITNMKTHIVCRNGGSTPQKGISIRNGFISKSLLHFNISALPKNAIINNASLSIVPDSRYGSYDSSAVIVYNSSDSAAYTINDSASATLLLKDSIYTANVQSLVYNKGNNINFILRNTNYYNGVERKNFFSTDADSTKRPLLKIYYSKRGN